MNNSLKLSMNLPLIPDVELVAIQGIEQLCAYREISSSKIDEAKILAGEAIINVIEHADSNKRETKFEFTVTDDQLIIFVQDFGTGFNIDKIPIPEIDEKMGAEKKRGWGLHLMRSLSDDFKIESGPSGTTITMNLNV